MYEMIKHLNIINVYIHGHVLSELAQRKQHVHVHVAQHMYIHTILQK